MKNNLVFVSALAALLAVGAANAQTTIVDIQSVDTGGGSDASPLLGQHVTVSGIVSASGEAGNLGAVYIQQPGEVEWAGIELRDSPGIFPLVVGDAVTVSGTVQERNGQTVLSVDFNNGVTVTGTGTIEPVAVDPDVFSSYSLAGNERYEGMLITLTGASGEVVVVDQNPDAPNNFGEWRVGSDLAQPSSGCRVLTGVSSSSASSSLNVSWINNIVWASNSGSLNVPPIVVAEGDSFVSMTGILSERFGKMKLLPRNNADVIVVLDSDGDGVDDGIDNCTEVANSMQTDADGDQIGNACDGDFNNDCIVNAQDLGILKLVFFSDDPVVDLNGDGQVNALDLGLFKARFFQPPGPAAEPNLCDGQ